MPWSGPVHASTTSRATSQSSTITALGTTPMGMVDGAQDSELRGGTSLPLNLIALIIAYIEDTGDLARVTRTSRVLYYMSLPRLYESVSLHSRSEIKYIDGRPEGFGGGSPFAMGLNGLVTRNVSNYVKHFRLWGDFRESNLEVLAKGRIPDDSMLLNVAVRAAIDQMPILESFSWELNSKPLKTVYQGLAARPSLRSLKIQFPSTRMPRPTTQIPPMPNLQSLTLLDIDPLCHPDDISYLLLHSRDLISLKIHFHPRIRENAEPSVNLDTYFGRCIAARQPLNLKHFSFCNLYAPKTNEFNNICGDDLESLTIINSGGSAEDNPMTVFIDDTWRIYDPHKHPPKIKSLRVDFVDRMFVHMLSEINPLESLYIVNARRRPGQRSNNDRHGTPVTPGQTPPELRPNEATITAGLAGSYMNNIIQYHGSNLKHLLLSHYWSLGTEDITRLVRGCPNLTQLGMALLEDNFNLLRILLPFLLKIEVVRMLMNPTNPTFVQKLEAMDDRLHEMIMGCDIVGSHFDGLKWVGVGKLIFRLGKVITEKVPDENGRLVERKRRIVKTMGPEAVKDVEIWSMDSVEP
ncbi:MAG: hypothetical protein M1820_001958 [Bogoriella megaspora]|nr:MAG: hypothetical protein M1820_001958 [Bogoriella megaspora]